MANITTEQFIETFNAGYETDEDALNAVRGLAFQWAALVAEAQANATRAQADVASQRAEARVQAALQRQQRAQSEFVEFIAGLE